MGAPRNPPPNPLLRETPPAPAEEVSGMRSNVLIATTAIIADIELPIPVLLLDTFHEQKRLPFSIQPWYEMQIQACMNAASILPRQPKFGQACPLC